MTGISGRFTVYTGTMSIESIIALTVTCFILMISPGPGSLATIARGLAHGLGRTLVFILGIVMGDLIYLFLAIFGLSALASAYGEVFVLIRWIGAAYLIYLGVRAWRAPTTPLEARPVEAARPVRDFMGGLLLTLGNPKVILLYTALLPSFIDLGSLGYGDMGIVAAIVSGVLFFVMTGYAWLADRSRRLFRSERAMRFLNRSSGAVMIGAGTFVAAKQ